MTMETIALVSVPKARFEKFETLTPAADATSTARLKGADGQPFDVRFLDDAALIYTHAPFDGDADDVLDLLDDRLDEALDDHDDERGVFVFPDKAAPRSATTYEAVIEEVGEVGEWIHLGADDGADDADTIDESLAGGMPMNGDLMQMVAGIANSLGPETLARMQSAMMSNDPNAMQRAQQEMMNALMQRDDLDQLAAQFQGLAAQLPPELLNMPLNASPEAIMDSLPPEQREALERQLAGRPDPRGSKK